MQQLFLSMHWVNGTWPESAYLLGSWGHHRLRIKCISAAHGFPTVLTSFDSSRAQSLLKQKCRAWCALTVPTDKAWTSGVFKSIREVQMPVQFLAKNYNAAKSFIKNFHDLQQFIWYWMLVWASIIKKYKSYGEPEYRSRCLPHAKRALYHLSYTPKLEA